MSPIPAGPAGLGPAYLSGAVLPHTVTVIPAVPTSTDGEGNVVRRFDDTAEYPGRLYQQSVSETQGEQTVERVRFKLILPAEAQVGPHDRVEVNGVTYEVDGTPYVVAGSRYPHHVQLFLKAV